MAEPDIGSVIDRHSELIMALEDVVGIGESRCNDRPCIKVLLARANAATLATLPAELEGIRLITEISGRLAANPQ